MGVILDSSVVIVAERNRETVAGFLERLLALTGDQPIALSAIGLTELVHGIYRARLHEQKTRRLQFLAEIRQTVAVYPYTEQTAQLAGRLDGEQQALGNTIPFADLLIGATALAIGFSVVTANPRHFGKIPGLHVIPLR